MGATYTKPRRANVKAEIKNTKKIKKINKEISKTMVSLDLLREALIDFYDFKLKEDENFVIVEEELIKAAKILSYSADLNLSDRLIEMVSKKLFKNIVEINNPNPEEIDNSEEIDEEINNVEE